MTDKRIPLQGKLKSVTFSVTENHGLSMVLETEKGSRTLVFHDSIKQGGRRLQMFHHKTNISSEGNVVILRTPAVSANDGDSIAGLILEYRFTFLEDVAAFYTSCSFNCDVGISDLAVKLLDVSWPGMETKTYTGYEYDAEDKPYTQTFQMPEKNPDTPDYDTLQKITPHAAWERMKTRPLGFNKAITIAGDGEEITIYGGKPLFYTEAEFICVYPELTQYEGDLRFYSGANSLGAWFIFEKQQDMFALFDALDGRVPALPVQQLPFVEKTVTVTSGSFATDIYKTPGGLWTGGEGLQSVPLFYICLWDTKYDRPMNTDSGAGWKSVEILERPNFYRFTLKNPEDGRADVITVVAEATCEPELNRVSWQLRAINRSERWSVMELSYPQCVLQGYDTAYASVGSGILMKRFNSNNAIFRGKYPVGVRVNMAFTAMYNKNGEGFYAGVHDPQGNVKFLYMAGARGTDSTLFTVHYPAKYQKKAGNSVTLPGKLIWQSFRGDWFDAVKIYREFVHTQASWLTAARGRTDTPQWLRQMPVWIMHFLPNENPDANPVPITLREKYSDDNAQDWYRTAIRFRQEIGVPVAYHVYNWHWVPFNNDNPHYFPARHDFKEGVQKLKEADIRIVPYMAAYSWDRHDHRGDDYRFESEALPNTAKTPDGKIVKKSYASTEPNGVAVEFARMCPTTPFWKDEVAHVASKLCTDYGADGIYLDVVSAAYDMCCDESHLHEPGYGSYWHQAYAELIAGIRSDVHENFAVVSESVSEVYASSLDGYLAWTWVQPDQVPAYPAVYGGMTAVFGRVLTLNKRDDADYCRFQMAQSLMFGQQLGWVHPEIVDDPQQFPFLKKLAQLRWKFAEFFAYAHMLRPPVVCSDAPLLDCLPFLRGQYMNHENTVLASAWENQEGKRCLFAVNSSNSEALCTLTVNAAEYDLPECVEAFTHAAGASVIKTERSGEEYKLHVKIAPQGYGVLEWM